MPSVAHIAALAAVLVVAGGSLRADDSPFAPFGEGAASSAAAQQQDFELSGASATGQGTEVCIFNAQTKHSAWIAVGSSRDGVQVLSFDPEHDQAVVSVNGAHKVLSLKKAAVLSAPITTYAMTTSAAPNPGSGTNYSSSQPAPTQPTPELERQAREARMMVSDLMEIGMEQRKAYAAARRAAALKAAGTANP